MLRFVWVQYIEHERQSNAENDDQVIYQPQVMQCLAAERLSQAEALYKELTQDSRPQTQHKSSQDRHIVPSTEGD